jgi:hypothetical protein
VPCHRLPVVSPDARSMKRPASRRPIPPQRRRSVPISNEHHLAEPDTLGTTIKLSFLDWRGPLAWRQRTTTSGAGTVTSIYGVGRRDVPGDPLAPGLLVQGPAPCHCSQPRAGRPATECERGRGLSALVDRGRRPHLPVRCVLSPPGSRRRSFGAGLARAGQRVRRVASWQSGQADQPAMAWLGQGGLS